MMNTFVSSQVIRLGVGRLSGLSLSVITHAGLITFAVVGSGRTASLASSHLEGAGRAERVTFVRPYVREAGERMATKGASAARAIKKAARLVVPDLSRLRASIDATLATVRMVPSATEDFELTAQTSRSDDFGAVDNAALLGGGSARLFAGPERYGAYSVDVVERRVWPRRENPVPHYPVPLMRAGVEATFTAEFVVDSTGRVDKQTFAFPTSAHPLLVKAVKDALLHSRYFPAELAGVRVRQLVRQQFTFVIAR